MTFDEQAAFDLAMPLTFAIVGQSKDSQLAIAPGTGFFVAPYIALTAKHVVDELWATLNLPWHQQQPTTTGLTGDFWVQPIQLLDIRSSRRDLVAVWNITGVTPCIYTDAAFLFVVPGNEVASRLTWPNGFPELELLPPSAGVEVFAFGYPASKIVNFDPGARKTNIQGVPTLVHGEVVAVHQNGRASWRFAQFETTAPFDPGLSGSPVFHDGRICGIASYGLSTAEGVEESYAASLWPLLIPEVPPSVNPVAQSTPILDLLRSGNLRASEWASIRARAKVVETESGHRVAVLEEE